MIFLENKYTKWYFDIIEKAKARTEHIGYFEKHHIIPKSCGGSNEVTNLVKLTAREHFICHLLLVKMTEGEYKKKMIYSAWFFKGNKLHRPLKINSHTHEYLKKLRSEKMMKRKQSQKEIEKRRSSNIGKKRTEETKANIKKGQLKASEEKRNSIEYQERLKLKAEEKAALKHIKKLQKEFENFVKSEKLHQAKLLRRLNKPKIQRTNAQKQHLREINLGKTLSEEAKNKISIRAKGRIKTEEHIKNNAAARTGQKRSQIAKDNMRNAHIGRKLSTEQVQAQNEGKRQARINKLLNYPKEVRQLFVELLEQNKGYMTIVKAIETTGYHISKSHVLGMIENKHIICNSLG